MKTAARTTQKKTVQVLNVSIDNLSSDQLMAKLADGGVVYTTNVDHLMKLQGDRDFYQAYSAADYRVCDSQILKYAARFLGTPVQEKISGSDLFPQFCDYYKHDDSVKIFLLGAAEGVAAEAMRRINKKAGRELVVAAHSPSYGFEKDEAECQRVVEMINQSGATVLAVGVGAPKQEKWIHRYRHQLPGVKVFMGVGATLDFEAGNVKRSPAWVSELGLEWLYRMSQEPGRLWRRYLLEDTAFFYLLLQQKMNRYRWSPTAHASRVKATKRPRLRLAAPRIQNQFVNHAVLHGLTK
ncbi:MAG: WecB/TagA/CpsF family glycosyltransferase [Cyanobacteria bacterium J06632_22]